MTLESLMKDKELKTSISSLIRGSGRSYPGKADEGGNKGTSSSVLGKQQVNSSGETSTIQSNGVPGKGTSVL